MDDLVVLVATSLVAVVVGLVVRQRPAVAVTLWATSVAVVPFWMGTDVAGVYLAPATALAGLMVVANVGRFDLHLRLPDLVVTAVGAIAVLAYLAGFGTVHSVVVAVLDWGLVYFSARVLNSLVDLRWTYGALALVLGIAGLLALVEFATGHNWFVGLPALGSYSGSGWRTLQQRGGIVRAEGAFGHSIALGATLAMGLPLALGSRLPHAVRAGTVVVLLAGAVVTFSRIGIGTSLIGLVLCVLLMRSQLTWRSRAALTALLAGAAVLAVPVIERVFSQAGQEASGSAQYRGSLLSLIPTMRLIGVSGAKESTADGARGFGGFQSIDSAAILAGLNYGTLVAGLLLGLMVAAAVLLLRREPGPAHIAMVAQIPAVLTVALITQYAMVFWFVAGLAVSGYAERVPARRPQSAAAPGSVQPPPTLVRDPQRVSALRPGGGPSEEL